MTPLGIIIASLEKLFSLMRYIVNVRFSTALGIVPAKKKKKKQHAHRGDDMSASHRGAACVCARSSLRTGKAIAGHVELGQTHRPPVRQRARGVAAGKDERRQVYQLVDGGRKFCANDTATHAVTHTRARTDPASHNRPPQVASGTDAPRGDTRRQFTNGENAPNT